MSVPRSFRAWDELKTASKSPELTSSSPWAAAEAEAEAGISVPEISCHSYSARWGVVAAMAGGGGVDFGGRAEFRGIAPLLLCRWWWGGPGNSESGNGGEMGVDGFIRQGVGDDL